MAAGTSCNGTDVERSIDGTSFTGVFRIDGICGDGTEPVPYSWLDAAPPELSTIYYRVKLGINGYSSVMAVVFDQLTRAQVGQLTTIGRRIMQGVDLDSGCPAS